MRILCTGDGTFTGDDLITGRYYDAVEADTPTEKQNRAFHALLQEFWLSGAHSYNVNNFEQFRDFIKRDLGAGFERYRYVVETPEGLKWGAARAAFDIPENVAHDANGNPLAAGILKSWTKYTKKERKETIDRLINTMIICGCSSRKFEEILKTMMEENTCK
ncbi:MAG: hypothetical protein LBB81_01410 [Treponema sp.]|jgi:hypothetical protein|nr:hypothetical protein [Treponema sp.]